MLYCVVMKRSICILGRQPALGRAELESLYGTEAVSAFGSEAAVLSMPSDAVGFSRLGGSTRLAEVLAELPAADWKIIEKELAKLVRSTAFAVPAEGKFHLGLSAYGFRISPEKLSAAALTLKKIIRTRGVSVRVVPNRDGPELSTAQVYHSHLAGSRGAELLIVTNGQGRTLIARTAAVQNIGSYTLRDRGRPKRDARVGMLPPKLAQIIINLAAGRRTDAAGAAGQSTALILDPFCGTGVVLQEALLMGYAVYGSDLEPRMVEYTRANLDWLAAEYALRTNSWQLETADATVHTWDLGRNNPALDVHLACETYLGRPFTELPARDVLEQTVSETNTIIKKFLSNLHSQLPAGTRLCLAVPAWHMRDGRRHLPLIGGLEALGYERVGFRHARTEELVYHRQDQIVGRELLVLIKNQPR